MIFNRLLRMDNLYYNGELEHITEIIKNRLYFGVTADRNSVTIKNKQNVYYFSVDDELLYANYYYDFGPLNISCLYKYCMKLHSFLKCVAQGKRIIHYTSSDPNKRTNAAFLMGCYAVLYLNMDPKQIYSVLLSAGGPYKNFVDASQGAVQFTIHLMDCFSAIEKASILNFFNFVDFNSEEYDKNDRLENGDMDWLVPRKFLAFIGPMESEANCCHKPEFYLNYFLRNDIRTVIRLNNKVYDESIFLAARIEHHELFFPDGTTPPKSILMRFLHICESAAGAIAVHCKAGLGRTGSLIGAYIVKHYRMSAREAIAWMRICRPGSVIGQQQGWLEKIESWLWRQGSQYRMRHYGEGDKIPRHKYGIYSMQWPKERQQSIMGAKIKKEYWVPNRQGEPKKRPVQSAQTRYIRYHELPKKKIFQNANPLMNISRLLPLPVVTVNTFCKKDEKSTATEHKLKPAIGLRQNRLSSALSKNSEDSKAKTKNSIYARARLENKLEINTQGDHLNKIKALRKLSAGISGKQRLTSVEKRNVGIGC